MWTQYNRKAYIGFEYEIQVMINTLPKSFSIKVFLQAQPRYGATNFVSIARNVK